MSADDDYERRSAQLATILERQKGVRTRIAASDDLDEQMRLEELLEDLVQKADRLENLTKSAHARIARVRSLEDNVDHKPTPGILTPALTPARPRKYKGGSEDEAMASASDTPDNVSNYGLGSPVGPVGPIGPVKRVTQSPEKKLNKQGTPTIPKPERVEIDLTLDSDDEVEPQAPPILLHTPRRPSPTQGLGDTPASQAPSSSPRRSPSQSSPRNASVRVLAAVTTPSTDPLPGRVRAPPS
ncbi:hypothetical protein EXIGLDRAFT_117994 [Exidia glandulosa HHB12029]|uniref:Uncharacterized protein n=1 Tax=Exidia glandulosa HHB12029 TaxID=1314781 RepID=A0A165GI74_EXIGL|nr:hypothetical protein EXIGLDRAFT_117994 [Exidia glandulosa HHB12029]